MGIFKGIFGEERSDKVNRWKKEIFVMLSNLEADGFFVDWDEDGDIIVNKGSAYGSVLFVEDDNDMYLVVSVPIVFLPQENCLAFYRKLLDMNFCIPIMGKFSTDEDRVYYRTLLDVDFITDDMMRLAVIESMKVADDIDDELSKEFGAKIIYEE